MVHGRIVPAGGSLSSMKRSACGAFSEKVYVGVEIRRQSGAPVHFGGGDCCDCSALSLQALLSFIFGSITGLSLSLFSGPSLSITISCCPPIEVIIDIPST